MANTMELVQSTTDRLLSAHLPVWLAGGWAEELHGIIPPRPHHDIDLLLSADSFDRLDEWISRNDVEEIKAKRLPHKRAFEVADTMVELIVISADLTTDFWGDHRYTWPSDTLDDITSRPRLVSPNALHQYRTIRPAPQPTGDR